MVQPVAVVSSSFSSLFLRFNPLKVLQPKRRLQQILASSPVPVPKPASGSGTAAPAATAPVAIPVPAPPAWDTLQLQSQRACSVAVAVALACTVATKTRPTAHRQRLCYLSNFRPGFPLQFSDTALVSKGGRKMDSHKNQDSHLLRFWIDSLIPLLYTKKQLDGVQFTHTYL